MFSRYANNTCQIFITAVVLTGTLICPAAIPAAVGNTVIAIGQAPAENPNHKQQALRAAFSAAVEQSIGVQVKSETLVQESQLIKDRILTRSEGLVKEWKSLREWNEAGLFSIEISAQVHPGELNKALFLNGIDVQNVYDWIGRPRILVAVVEDVDGKGVAASQAQSELESLFREKGITVVHGGQLEKIKSRDVKLAFDRPEKALSLGNRLGAEIVIVGKSISKAGRVLEIGGFKQYFYSTVLEVKAYRTSNAELLMSSYYTEKPGEESDTSALSKHDASLRSIRSLVQANSKDVVFRVVKNWFDGMSKGSNIQVVISGVKGSELSELEKHIASLPDVASVHRRSFNRGTGELDVEYSGQQSALVTSLEEDAGLKLNLVSEEPNRISYEKERR